jgi:hypothetical protein
MPNSILRVGPFLNLIITIINGRQIYYLNEPDEPSINVIPVNCNISSWASSETPSWKYYVGGISSGEYGNVTGEGATVNETIDGSSGGLLEGDGIFFAYQAAEDFTLAGTYSATGESGQQDTVLFSVGYDRDTFLYQDSDSKNISGSYSVTLPAAVKPKTVFLEFLSETTASGTITIDGINPT